MKLAKVFTCGLGLLLLAPGLASAQIGVEYFSSDSIFDIVLSEAVFTAEGRAGDLGGTGTYELDLGGAASPPAATADFAWQSGAAQPFTLTYNAHTGLVTFVLGGRTLTYVTPFSGFDAVFVRTESLDAGSFVGVYDLVLDGMAVPGASTAAYPAHLKIMQIYNAPVADGFTLTGTVKLRWEGQAPAGSRLAFQIKTCHMAVVPAETPTWGQLKNLYR